MEFNLSWVLLGFPVAFALGWLACRLDGRQWRLEQRHAPKAYFKGLNHLLNEQQDAAIDAFIEAVRIDPDTSELHFALGNLFRRRGEYERAIRVHEHLLARADLSAADRLRAQYALGLDFLNAGLIDRAESALLKLEGSPFEGQARLALLGNFERAHDWAQAHALAQRMHAAGQAELGTRLSHYLCELALLEAQPVDRLRLLQQALAAEPQAPRAHMLLAQLQSEQGQLQAAWQTLAHAWQTCPQARAHLAAALAHTARHAQAQSEAAAWLAESYALQPSLDILLARVAMAPNPAAASQLWAQHLQHHPSLVAAAHWLALNPQSLQAVEIQPSLQHAIDHAATPLLRWRCAACGFEAGTHFWQCPGCQSWDSYPAQRLEELNP